MELRQEKGKGKVLAEKRARGKAQCAPGRASCPGHFLDSHCADNSHFLFHRDSPGPSPLRGQICSQVKDMPTPSCSGRCWTSAGAHGCIMRGLVAWGRRNSNPTPDALRTVFIHSLNICEFTSTTRWGEYSGECSARALAMELLTDQEERQGTLRINTFNEASQECTLCAWKANLT